MSPDQEVVFPHNGYALLADLVDTYVRAAHHEIKQLETCTGFSVLKYWNRRWEYPFFMCSMKTSHKKKGVVLDAGAGKSLLPFWLARNGFQVVAFDLDNGTFYPQGTLNAWYAQQNKRIDTNVSFIKGDVQQLQFSDEMFDTVCSMSVLEHVTDPVGSLKELWRVLKPSGHIIVTVDVSLDGSRSLHKDKYQEMKSFLDLMGSPLYSSIELGRDSELPADRWILTTDWFQQNDPSALPWGRVKRPIKDRIKALVTGDVQSAKKWCRHFDSMVVAGLAYKK